MKKKQLVWIFLIFSVLGCSKGMQGVYEQLNDPVRDQPKVETEPPVNITAVSAFSGGFIAEGNISPVMKRGVCWGEVSKPSLKDRCTENGDGTGFYMSSITGLQPDKTYFVRAYVTYKGGTNYGEEQSFKTLSSANDITEFKFLKIYNPALSEDYVGVIEYNTFTSQYEITVKMSYSVDRTNLKASFSYVGGSIKVGSVVQVSESTSNDFSSPVIYEITALNGIDKRSYTLKVILSYQLSYDANGATGGLAPSDKKRYENSETVNVLGNIGNMIKTGANFGGWEAIINGVSKGAVSGSFTQSALTGSGDIVGNVVLKAVWNSKSSITVTYQANGGTGTQADANTYSPGDQVTVLGQGSMTKDKAIFIGWNTNLDGYGTAYAAGSTMIIPSSNVVLYAQWLSGYKVYYDSGLANASSDTGVYFPGQKFILKGQEGLTPPSVGMVFKGWKICDSEGFYCGVSVFVQGSQFVVDQSDFYFFSVWQ